MAFAFRGDIRSLLLLQRPTQLPNWVSTSLNLRSFHVPTNSISVIKLFEQRTNRKIPEDELKWRREREGGHEPPISGLIQGDVPDPDVRAPDEPHQPRPTLVAQARPGLVPADHHVLPLVEPPHELQPLPVHHPAAGDPDVACPLGQYHVPPVGLRRVVPDLRAPEHRRPALDVQHHAGLEPDRLGQVLPRGESDAAGAAGGGGGEDGGVAGVDGGLDRGGVVAAAVAGGAEVSDGDGGGGGGRSDGGLETRRRGGRRPLGEGEDVEEETES